MNQSIWPDGMGVEGGSCREAFGGLRPVEYTEHLARCAEGRSSVSCGCGRPSVAFFRREMRGGIYQGTVFLGVCAEHVPYYRDYCARWPEEYQEIREEEVPEAYRVTTRRLA